jgi:hypothetical protein
MGEITRRVAGKPIFLLSDLLFPLFSSLPFFNSISFASFLALFSEFFLLIFTLSAPSSAERDFAVPS